LYHGARPPYPGEHRFLDLSRQAATFVVGLERGRFSNERDARIAFRFHARDLQRDCKATPTARRIPSGAPTRTDSRAWTSEPEPPSMIVDHDLGVVEGFEAPAVAI
jgi:hypothetical protein